MCKFSISDTCVLLDGLWEIELWAQTGENLQCPSSTGLLLFLLEKVSHLFSIEVLARSVILLMFLLYIGSGGWKTNVCWLLIRVGAKIAAAIRVSPQDLRPLHLWKAKN